jgi:hypothetical protein
MKGEKRKKMIIVACSFCWLAALQRRHNPTVMEKYDVLGEGEGSSVGIMLFNVIPIGQNDRFENAYKDAISSKNGDALINPVISERWFWAYVLNGYITTVKGTVIKYK